jgi:hypothetical protein
MVSFTTIYINSREIIKYAVIHRAYFSGRATEQSALIYGLELKKNQTK